MGVRGVLVAAGGPFSVMPAPYRVPEKHAPCGDAPGTAFFSLLCSPNIQHQRLRAQHLPCRQEQETAWEEGDALQSSGTLGLERWVGCHCSVMLKTSSSNLLVGSVLYMMELHRVYTI